ncbi:MAG: exodeoxyribonuclease VII small subunit [Clostridia bacterium]|nr:exodeoxyribonuclease VII small subunit [Clostridia bacterium]
MDTFEKALKDLKECVDKISLKDNSLEESIKAYTEGIKHYETCKEILDKAKQEIIIDGKDI